MSTRKKVLIKLLSGIFSCVATWFLNYFIVSNLESRLGIYSSSAQVILLAVQMVVIYAFSQMIFFKKLTRVEVVLLSAAYGISIISVLFLRYPNIGSRWIFSLGSYYIYWPFSLNPISFIFDAAADHSSILVSILNVFLFVPLKPFLAANRLQPKWWIILAGFVAVELFQFILMAGSFDLGDIVLYFAGYLAGYGILNLYLDKSGKAHTNQLPIILNQ